MLKNIFNTTCHLYGGINRLSNLKKFMVEMVGCLGPMIMEIDSAFVSHDVKYHFIRLGHTVMADACQIMNCAVDILFYNTFGSIRVTVLHGKVSTQNRRGNAAGDLKCATRFGSVTNHAADIGNHVPDGVCDFFKLSSHEIGEADCRTRSGDNTATESGQTTE